MMTEPAATAPAEGGQPIPTAPGSGTPPAPGAGAAQDGAQAPFWAGLPDHLKGADPESTLKKLLPAFDGYHKAASARGPVPKEAKEYVFETPNEKLKGYFGAADDPAMGAAREAALKAGLTTKQFNAFIEDTFAPLVASGQLPAPVNPAEIVKAQAALLGFKELNDQSKAALEAATGEMIGFATNLGKQMNLSETAQMELESLALTPGGFELLRALPAAMGKEAFRLGGQATSTGEFYSKEELHQMDADPRIDPSKFGKFDKAAREKYDRSYAHHYARGGTSR
jgi:hypothetical protein